MKNFVLIITVIILGCGLCLAKSDKQVFPHVKFDGAKYTLFYSAKSKELGSYINEYYKKNQTYTTWNELIALHHYPNAYSPIDQAKEFKTYLQEENIPSELDIDEKHNCAALDFIVISQQKRPILLEFNIFRFVKSPKCGTIGFQYAKRYKLNNALEIKKFKKTVEKERKKYIKKFKKVTIPELIYEDIDMGKYLRNEGIEKGNDDVLR